MSFIKFVEKYNFDSMYSKPERHVVSKAYSISKNTAAVDKLLLKLKSRVVSKPHTLNWRARKPNSLAFSR
jgi:hypothetical protein